MILYKKNGIQAEEFCKVLGSKKNIFRVALKAVEVLQLNSVKLLSAN
jgi:hypothetical protein